jgi:small neutral amino acid transporter SnatA (MarC family)
MSITGRSSLLTDGRYFGASAVSPVRETYPDSVDRAELVFAPLARPSVAGPSGAI